MRHFCFLILLFSFKLNAADLSTEKYIDSVKKISEGCLSYKIENGFCNDYQNINNNFEKWGQIYGEKLLKVIPFPSLTIFSSYVIKSLIENKVVIDPKMKQWGNPKIEIKQNEALFSVSYDLN